MNVTEVIASISGDSLAAILNGPVADSLPGAGLVCALGSAAVLGYAVFEQLKFQVYKRGTDKRSLPGVCGGERPGAAW